MASNCPEEEIQIPYYEAVETFAVTNAAVQNFKIIFFFINLYFCPKLTFSDLESTYFKIDSAQDSDFLVNLGLQFSHLKNDGTLNFYSSIQSFFKFACPFPGFEFNI